MSCATKLRYQKVIHNCYSRNGNVYIQKEINGNILQLNKQILNELRVNITVNQSFSF